MAVDKRTGRAGRATIDSVTPHITKWDVTIKNDMQDLTGSDNYDEETDTLWKSQGRGATNVEGSIEGKFDVDATTGTTAAVIQKIFSATGVPVVLSISPDIDFGYGNFDFSEVQVSLEVPTEVTFTASIMSNGTFTLGSPS